MSGVNCTGSVATNGHSAWACSEERSAHGEVVGWRVGTNFGRARSGLRRVSAAHAYSISAVSARLLNSIRNLFGDFSAAAWMKSAKKKRSVMNRFRTDSMDWSNRSPRTSNWRSGPFGVGFTLEIVYSGSMTGGC